VAILIALAALAGSIVGLGLSQRMRLRSTGGVLRDFSWRGLLQDFSWRGLLRVWPLWLPASYLSIWAIRGVPTLSNPIVYPPLGWDAILAGTPGLAWLMVAFLVAGQPEARPAAFCGRQLALAAGLGVAALVACRGIEAMASVTAGPPLAVLWTAQASVLMSLFAAGAWVLALGCVVLAVRRS
jgi:hypothetical protein